MDTLVLSPAFEPMAIVPWQRAITLLWEGKVETVEESERVLRSATQEFRSPSVIRFIKATRSRRKAIKFSRENVYARDRGQCQYCGSRVAPQEATYDHVTPRAQGGATVWDNVVIACVPCNQRKGGRTPQQAGMHLRTVPVKPKSVPEAFLMKLHWRPWMPQTWKGYMRSATYWADELEK